MTPTPQQMSEIAQVLSISILVGILAFVIIMAMYLDSKNRRLNAQHSHDEAMAKMGYQQCLDSEIDPAGHVHMRTVWKPVNTK